MDRYSLASQSMRILSAVSAGAYVLTLNIVGGGIFGQFGLFLAAVVTGYLLGFLIPKILIRWTLDRQAAVGSFAIAYLMMIWLAAALVLATLSSDFGRHPIGTFIGGFLTYMIFGSFAALIGAVFAWYPTLATFLYLRDRKDYL